MPCITQQSMQKSINQKSFGDKKSETKKSTGRLNQEAGGTASKPKSRFSLTERPDFTTMPRNIASALMRAVAAMFSFVRVPDVREPFVVWAHAHMYNGDVPVEDLTDEEKQSTQACFPLAAETNAQWWSRHHRENVLRKTAKGPWIHNRKRPDWSKDNSYAAMMRDPRRVEYITRLAEIDDEDSVKKAELKKQYETDPEFMPLTLGITKHTDMPYFYAHGGRFQLSVEFTYIEGTEALPFKQRKIDKTVPPKYRWSFEVPILDEEGMMTRTAEVTHFSEAVALIVEQVDAERYSYDRYRSFRGIPLVTNTFPKHPKAAADAKPKQFQTDFKTRMGIDTGKMNRKAEELAHLVKEAKRVLCLMGFKTDEEHTAEVEKAVVNRVKKALIHWKHKVCYQTEIGDDAIKTEFEVKHIWSQYYACQMALQTASVAELASGTVQTPKKGGSLVWTLEKDEKGVWTARLDRTWKEHQRKLKEFRSMSRVATQEDQVAKGGSKGGGFAALEVDVDLSKDSTKPKKPMNGFKAAAKRGQEATPVCPVASVPGKKTKTRAQQRKENKAKKTAESLAAYRASKPCKFGAKCGNPDCGFKHPEGAKTPEERKANLAAFKAAKAAKKAAKEAATIDIVLEEEEDVAGPAEEQVQERTSVTEAMREEEREKMRAEMQAQMEAEMKAQMEAEREKMREAIRKQMMAEEEEKKKKNSDHQEKVKAGVFSKRFEMDFSKKEFATPAPKTTPKVARALPTGPLLSKGAPMRLGPQMRLGPKVLRADKSSKA